VDLEDLESVYQKPYSEEGTVAYRRRDAQDARNAAIELIVSGLSELTAGLPECAEVYGSR